VNRLDLREELDSRPALLTVTRGTCLHSTEWHLWLDSGRFTVDLDTVASGLQLLCERPNAGTGWDMCQRAKRSSNEDRFEVRK
jgi:hypothetical protein